MIISGILAIAVGLAAVVYKIRDLRDAIMYAYPVTLLYDEADKIAAQLSSPGSTPRPTARGETARTTRVWCDQSDD